MRKLTSEKNKKRNIRIALQLFALFTHDISLLRYYATSRKLAGLIPDEFVGFLY
jgi:hypothetical protein